MAVLSANGCGSVFGGEPKEDDDGPCVDPGGHEFVYFRVAVGKGWKCGPRRYCIHCGAEGNEE